MSSQTEWENYIPSQRQQELVDTLIALLQECDRVGLFVSVFGGYGLDALYGKLTRDHGDFDLIVETQMEDQFVEILERHGYVYSEELSEPGRKACYLSENLGGFKLEYVTLDENKLMFFQQQFGIELEMAQIFPFEPNGQLLGFDMRVPTIEIVQIVGRIQAQTGAARGWGEFQHQEHQEALVDYLKAK
ncbi:nucleotidyltransferase family protein [Chloroflexi bacterium TSY]|nr:nucleotidyltransferase family protein [Chloroflexi bacterium TSY]